ncbi:unnamed protein product [Acanthoscelides obtectus]|nr:unnamed protein product [Acanthoscelides obtectus]CAK1678264.1 39S ribosomal protein L40, mitochondrial [Acanthoscelides obtectus]
MSLLTSSTKLSRILSVPRNIILRNIALTAPNNFHASQVLLAEPLKKKKRLDPAVVRAREERKKKKIEKQIRRLEKNARQLKPIEECQLPLQVSDNVEKRQRVLPPLSSELLEKRVMLMKKWSQFKHAEHLKDLQILDKLVYNQQKALDELQKESPELYYQAIQFDFQLMNFTCQGPVETPPIVGYDVPDGDYQDKTKKW